MPDLNDFQKRVAELRVRFDERLEHESAEIFSLAQVSAREGGAALERIRFLAHGIRGSAPTFGRDDAGRVAAELENVAAELLDAPSALTPAESGSLASLARQLRTLSRKGAVAGGDETVASPLNSRIARD